MGEEFSSPFNHKIFFPTFLTKVCFKSKLNMAPCWHDLLPPLPDPNGGSSKAPALSQAHPPGLPSFSSVGASARLLPSLGTLTLSFCLFRSH